MFSGSHQMISLFSYKILQNLTKSYKVLQSLTKSYKVLQNLTKSYKVLQSLTKCYKKEQNVTKSYKILQHLDFSKCGVNINPTRISQSSHNGNWPWMGSLGEYSNGNWSHFCGATLINKTTVITAARCVKDEKNVVNRYVILGWVWLG